MSLSYTSARLRLAASGDFGARWALWVPWVTAVAGTVRPGSGGGNARLMAGERNDNLPPWTPGLLRRS